MGINAGSSEIAVAQVVFDRNQRCAFLQHMATVRMAQRMDINFFSTAACGHGLLENVQQRLPDDRTVQRSETRFAGLAGFVGREKQYSMAMRTPQGCQFLQHKIRKRNLPPLVAFAANREQAAGTVNIAHSQVESFGFAQTAAVNQLQRSAVADIIDATQRGGNFILAQDYFFRTVFF